MQIEETFRDQKNVRWGMSLRYARCHDGERMQILLLIAALASMLQWLFGSLAQRAGLAARFQANTERRRTVLSTVFLGQQVLMRLGHPLPEFALDDALLELQLLIPDAAYA